MKTALACCIALVGTAAWAAGPPISVGLHPPVQFQHDAVMTVQFSDPDRVPSLCVALIGQPTPGTYASACWLGETVIMPNPCRWPNRSDYSDLLCHELGHLNGWPVDHSDPSKHNQGN